MVRVRHVHIALEGGAGVFHEVAFDGARIDGDNLDVAAAQFQTQCVGQPLKRELGGIVGTTVLERLQAQKRRALDDPPFAAPAHHGQQQRRQFMPAEEVGRELLFHHGARDVFDRTRLAIGAVVEQRKERAARALLRFGRAGLDRRGVAVVECDRLKPFAFQPAEVFVLSRRCQHTIAPCLEPARASQADPCRTSGDENALLPHGRLLGKKHCFG